MIETLDQFVERLQHVTRDCRVDMHEPDEAGLECEVVGQVLDNAMTAHPDHSFDELLVGLTDKDGNQEWFNLADMIAALRSCGQRPVLRRRTQ